MTAGLGSVQSHEQVFDSIIGSYYDIAAQLRQLDISIREIVSCVDQFRFDPHGYAHFHCSANDGPDSIEVLFRDYLDLDVSRAFRSSLIAVCAQQALPRRELSIGAGVGQILLEKLRRDSCNPLVTGRLAPIEPLGQAFGGGLARYTRIVRGFPCASPVQRLVKELPDLPLDTKSVCCNG